MAEGNGKTTKVPKNVEYDQKSGVVSVTEYPKIMGGMPPTKKIDEIEKVNRVDRSPTAIGY